MQTTNLQERFNQVCYRRILPHLDKYRAEPCLDNCIPLMEPYIFAGFAEDACRSVAGLVAEEARNKYRNLCHFPAAVRRLNPGDGDADGLNDELAFSLNPFASALQQFSAELDRFRQLFRTAANPVVQQGGKRLQQSFNAMIEAYDQTMTALVETACTWLDDYDNDLRRAAAL